MIILPSGVKANELVRDPANRHGHWLDERTQTVFNMGPDFRPETDNEKVTEDPDKTTKVVNKGMIGKRVEVTIEGELKGKRGMITATDGGDDDDMTSVLLDGSDGEYEFNGVGHDLRLLSQNEVDLDEIALRNRKLGTGNG